PSGRASSVIFFISSRRRHTRSKRDWSSDVCSSDLNVDFVAASFIREQSDVLSIQKLLEDNDAAHIKIISKIENREGVDNINEILDASYGIMVARGDLGVEIPAEEVPLV